LGYRPTFDDQHDLVAEAHLLDYSGDLYGRKIDLDFLALIRPEQKFPSVDALKIQIDRDVAALRVWLEENPEKMPAVGKPRW
jgi:riboflavin kinase/FMN adenylyltransferase